MSEDWKPDVKIAETYVRHGEQEFQVYTFERSSSAVGYGDHRYHETHVYEWDQKNRMRVGAMIGQHNGSNRVDLHCHIVSAIARHGRDYGHPDVLPELTTAEALRQWRKLAKQLYDWELIEAVKPFCVPYKGPRRGKPEGYEELSNGAGVPPEDFAALVEATETT